MYRTSAALSRATFLLALATLILAPAPAHAQDGTATLVAVLTDTTGTPLADGVVWVGMRINAVTDDSGTVTIRDIPPGEHLVRFRHDSHRTESVILAFEAGAYVEIEADLEPAITAIQLPGITVQAERRAPHLVREGFYERKHRGLGSYVEREDIRRLGTAGDLCRVFDDLRGFRAWSPYGRCVVSSGGGGGLRITDGAGAAAMSGGCAPTFLVDGMPWDGEMVASLSPIHVEAVEGYSGPATTPGRFVRGMNNPCGTILIWLRW